MLKRIWRWIANPTPLAGQTWYVDGVGLMKINRFVMKGAFSKEVEGKSLVHLRDEYYLTHVKTGETYTYTKSELLTSGFLWEPKSLKELSSITEEQK